MLLSNASYTGIAQQHVDTILGPVVPVFGTLGGIHSIRSCMNECRPWNDESASAICNKSLQEVIRIEAMLITSPQ